jgi:hypothetical protein
VSQGELVPGGWVMVPVMSGTSRRASASVVGTIRNRRISGPVFTQRWEQCPGRTEARMATGEGLASGSRCPASPACLIRRPQRSRRPNSCAMSFPRADHPSAFGWPAHCQAYPWSADAGRLVRERAWSAPGHHRGQLPRADQDWPVRMMGLRPPIRRRYLRLSGHGTRPCGSWHGPGRPEPPAPRLGAKGSYCVGLGAPRTWEQEIAFRWPIFTCALAALCGLGWVTPPRPLGPSRGPPR